MRLLFVVQRYGHEVPGGAERACRELASHLAGRGHDVDALTSCAVSYADWADAYPPGTSELDGVTVHRLPVRRPRDIEVFGPLNGRVAWGRKPVPLHLQREWMRLQGPDLPALRPWLADRADGYDAVVFFCYLYPTAWGGLPVAGARTATVFHPLAHDEPQLRLPLFRPTFRIPDVLAYLVEEEQELVERELHPGRPSAVVGLGFDLDVSGDGGRFRARFGLGDDPFLLFIGRIDPNKGADELVDFFTALKRRSPGPLKLVLLGDPVHAMAPHPDIVVTGFVDDDTKRDALDACLSLVVPSFYESFSMVLAEAWVQRRPALVQGHCAVLEGQARRSGGAIPYRGFAAFEAAVEEVTASSTLAPRLGDAGRRYVEARYSWTSVLDTYEAVLGRAVEERRRRRPTHTAPGPASAKSSRSPDESP